MAKPGIETFNEDGTWKSRRQGNNRAFSAGGQRRNNRYRGVQPQGVIRSNTPSKTSTGR